MEVLKAARKGYNWQCADGLALCSIMTAPRRAFDLLTGTRGILLFYVVA